MMRWPRFNRFWPRMTVITKMVQYGDLSNKQKASFDLAFQKMEKAFHQMDQAFAAMEDAFGDVQEPEK